MGVPFTADGAVVNSALPFEILRGGLCDDCNSARPLTSLACPSSLLKPRLIDVGNALDKSSAKLVPPS